MNTTITIETAPPDMWKEVLSVTMESYREYESQSNPEFWTNYQKSIERSLLVDDQPERIVARLGSTILGAVLYCPPYERKMGNAIVKNPFPEMRLLAVPPRSRNRGIGAKLIDYCEEKARASGSPTITLHTTVLMQTAKQMYERRGYKRFEEIDFEPVPGFIVWGYKKVF